MKNLTTRTKSILAIVGVVIVVGIVVGVALAQGSAGQLFGAASDLAITPSNPTIAAGNSTGLSVNAKYNCAWSSSNSAIVSLVNYSGETKSVTVRGNVAGTATITAKCGLGIFNVNHVATTVTVIPPLAITPSNPSVVVGESAGLSVNSVYTCNWTSSSGAVTFVGATAGSSVTVKGNTVGQSATITAQCGTWGSTTAVVTVSDYPNFVFSPASKNIYPDDSFSLNAPVGARQPCTWTISSAVVVKFLVNGQRTTAPQTGPAVTVTGTGMTGSQTVVISCLGNRSADFLVHVCPKGDAQCMGTHLR